VSLFDAPSVVSDLRLYTSFCLLSAPSAVLKHVLKSHFDTKNKKPFRTSTFATICFYLSVNASLHTPKDYLSSPAVFRTPIEPLEYLSLGDEYLLFTNCQLANDLTSHSFNDFVNES